MDAGGRGDHDGEGNRGLVVFAAASAASKADAEADVRGVVEVRDGVFFGTGLGHAFRLYEGRHGRIGSGNARSSDGLRHVIKWGVDTKQHPTLAVDGSDGRRHFPSVAVGDDDPGDSFPRPGDSHGDIADGVADVNGDGSSVGGGDKGPFAREL